MELPLKKNPLGAILGLNFLYNLGYNYYWYDKTNKYIYQAKMRRFGFLYLQLYAINLIDIIETHHKGLDKPWPQDPFSDRPLKSPWGAVARSAMLPGWGQCYNESYIKSVLAFGSAFYIASRIRHYDKAYKRSQNQEDKDRRVANSWYLGFAYLIILVDAYVDAYLYRFEDIVQLTYHYLPEDRAFTMGVQIAF